MVHRKLKQAPADILPRQGEKILLASANMKYGLGGQSGTAVKKCTHYNSPLHKYREIYACRYVE